MTDAELAEIAEIIEAWVAECREPERTNGPHPQKGGRTVSARPPRHG